MPKSPNSVAHSPLDALDRAILNALMREGRLTNVELADRVHLSAAACLRRVQRLEASGIVAGYALLLDPVRAGVPGAAFVSVTLDAQGRAALDEFERAVERHDEILECYLVAGSADYMLRVAYRDSADFERIHTDIITRLPGVSRVQSTLALRTVKRTTRLPI